MNKRKLKFYGVLTTFNPYTNTWFAFSREDDKHYWAGDINEIVLGKGKTAIQAIEDYLSRGEDC